MYYLKKLMAEGTVGKTAELYHLTPAGKRFADTLSLKTFQPRIQPKIVTLIICTNAAGEYLLYRRSHEPFINLVGFPYGKIHLGETVQGAAERELKEKTGMSTKLTHKGDAYITVYDHKELVSQMLTHILVGKNPTGKLITHSSIGECFWANPSNFTKTELLPANAELRKLANGSQHFFREFIVDL